MCILILCADAQGSKLCQLRRGQLCTGLTSLSFLGYRAHRNINLRVLPPGCGALVQDVSEVQADGWEYSIISTWRPHKEEDGSDDQAFQTSLAEPPNPPLKPFCFQLFILLHSRTWLQNKNFHQYLNKMVHLPNSNSFVANQILQHFHKCLIAETLLTAKGIFRTRVSFK